MKQKILLNKHRGFYGLCLLRLKEIEESYNYIPISLVFQKLCRNYSASKQEIREILFLLRDFGLLDISPKGIKLNFEVKNEE
ncbi:MAG: hypothetical protein AABX72_02980 [Nanoarchaeota archaeon]